MGAPLSTASRGARDPGAVGVAVPGLPGTEKPTGSPA